MPVGVSPSDVKMLQATYHTLALVTCNGDAYVMSANSYAWGDNSVDGFSTTRWHRVRTSGSTPLVNVIQMRASDNTLIALTSDNKLYTWGTYSYKGDGSGVASLKPNAYAMTQPSGIIKMIGVTANSLSNPTYYALTTTGELYGLGENTYRQIGDFTTSTRTSWTRVKSSASVVLNDVAWFSPSEHDKAETAGAVNAITKDGTLWSWGMNDEDMLGITGRTSGSWSNYSEAINPTKDHYLMVGGTVSEPSVFPSVFAVETGGHLTVAVLECQESYGYAGHATKGSFGDGTSSAWPGEYRGYFEVKPNVNSPLVFCGIQTDNASLAPIPELCYGGTASHQLVGSPAGGVYSVESGNATVTPTGMLTLTGKGPVTVAYRVGYECSDASIYKTTIYPYDRGNLDPAKWPNARASLIAEDLTAGAWAGLNNLTQRANSECATLTSDPADGLKTTNTGAGTLVSPWKFTKGSTINFTLNLSGTNVTSARYGIWVDMDNNGSFLDAGDVFVTGTGAVTNPSARVNASVSVPLPSTGAGGAAALRLMVGSEVDNTTAWTQAQMVEGFTITNGEVEDYYLDVTNVINLSGNLFNDANGLLGTPANTVDGPGIPQPDGVQMYANLLDASGNVVMSTPIAADGSYSFANVPVGDYTMIVTDSPTKATPALPANWVNTGENIGATAGSDGTNDGRLAVSVTPTSTDITDINFGIDKRPESDDKTHALPTAPNNSTLFPLTSASGLSPLSGSDQEDGTMGSGKSLKITDLSGMNGNELYYDGVLVTAGQVIPNYDPDKLSIKYVTAATTQSAVFNYAFIDAAGVEDLTPATYTITWSILPVTWAKIGVVEESGNAIVTWSTTEEMNVASFKVQTSVNASNWETVGMVPATNKANMSYRFVHKLNGGGNHYYRIESVDIDGSTDRSSIVSLNSSLVVEAKVIYPNPVDNGEVTLGMPIRGLKDVQVFNNAGIPMSVKLNGNVLNVRSLTAGHYVLRVVYQNGEVVSKTFIVK